MQNTPSALIEGDANAWSVGITRETIQRIIACRDTKSSPGDMIALWMFYAYTARWQNVNRPKATTNYTTQGLGWRTDRVIRAKSGLRTLGLIRDVKSRDTTNKITGWYIQVFHLAKTVHPQVISEGGKAGSKCSRSNILNAQGNETLQKSKAHTGEPVRVISPEWKPDPRSKEQQLEALPVPRDYPSQPEFEAFIDVGCPLLVNYRPDLYASFCLRKWREWKPKYNRWVPIRDWRKLVSGLEQTILDAAVSSRL